MEKRVIQLEYAARPRWWRRKGRMVRWGIVSLLVIAGACGAWWRKEIWREGSIRFWEWQCGRYAGRTDEMIYTDVPGDVARLKGDVRYWVWTRQEGVTAAMERRPRCYEELCRVGGIGRFGQGAVAYMGWRENGKGQKRLVVMDWHYYQRGGTIKRDGVVGRPTAEFRFCGDVVGGIMKVERGNLRVFAGQADREDGSKFKVRFEADGKEGWVIGRLKDDGKMEFSVWRGG